MNRLYKINFLLFYAIFCVFYLQGTYIHQKELLYFFDAIQGNDIKQVKKMLHENNGANLINMQDEALGKTPLIFAVEAGYLLLVELLLEYGADPFLEPQADSGEAYSYQFSKNPLIIAVEQENEEIVSLLLNNLRSSSCNTVNILNMQNHEHYKNEIDRYDLATGKSPLIIAIEKNNKQLVELLLKSGADPNVRVASSNQIEFDNNDYDKTPLIIAVENGYEEIVQLLISYQANPNMRDTSDKEDNKIAGSTPLKYAIESGSVNLVSLLIKAGADTLAYQDSSPIKKQIKNFSKLLHVKNLSILAYALCICASDEIIDILISAGADQISPDPLNKYTYLEIAHIFLN